MRCTNQILWREKANSLSRFKSLTSKIWPYFKLHLLFIIWIIFHLALLIKLTSISHHYQLVSGDIFIRWLRHYSCEMELLVSCGPGVFLLRMWTLVEVIWQNKRKLIAAGCFPGYEKPWPFLVWLHWWQHVDAEPGWLFTRQLIFSIEHLVANRRVISYHILYLPIFKVRECVYLPYNSPETFIIVIIRKINVLCVIYIRASLAFYIKLFLVTLKPWHWLARWTEFGQVRWNDWMVWRQQHLFQ